MNGQKNLPEVTVAYHWNPDLEEAFIDWVLVTFGPVLAAMGFSTIRARKFIPSGPLRFEDWTEYGTVDPSKLKKFGFEFVDCGGARSRFDQHRQDDCRDQASIDRLVEFAVENGAELEWLLPLVRVVSANDLYATDTSVGNACVDAVTPHVQRHMRNFLHGLNLCFPTDPERVIMLSHMAFNAMAATLRVELKKCDEHFDASRDEDTSEMTDEEFRARIQKRSAREEAIARRLLGWDNILAGVRKIYAHEPEYVTYFEKCADVAWKALENEWQVADRDYWAETTRGIPNVEIDPTAFGLPADGRDSLTVVSGFSKSTRFGARVRLGNCEKRRRNSVRPRPQTNRPVRLPGDIILQVFETGEKGTKFLVSTRGNVTIEPISYALRLADLRERFLCLETEAGGMLAAYCGSVKAADALAAALKKDGRNVRPSGKSVLINRPQGVKVSTVAQAIQRVSSRTVIVLDATSRNQLASSGNNTVKVYNARWEELEVSVLYFADFLKSLGNAHNTNPFAAYSALSPESVLSIVLHTMRRTAEDRREREQTAKA